MPHIDKVDLNAFKSLINLNCCQGRLRVIGDIQIAHHTMIFNPIGLIPLVVRINQSTELAWYGDWGVDDLKVKIFDGEVEE